MRALVGDVPLGGSPLRYRVDETDDGLSGEEGTFAICSDIGEHDRARAFGERMLGYASPLDLCAEEIGARAGRVQPALEQVAGA